MEYNTFLFLDDERSPYQVNWVPMPQQVYWHIVRNFNEFKRFIETKGVPTFISFDHDLNPEHYPKSSEDFLKPIDRTKYKEKTGFECAEFLLKYCMENGVSFPHYQIHSMNPVGVKDIRNLIETARKEHPDFFVDNVVY